MKILNRKNLTQPATLGYRMPAEWEKHEATWLVWPHNDETWPTQLAAVEEIYLQMIEALALGEKVNVLVNDSREENLVRQRLSKRGTKFSQIFFFQIPTVDVWIRDYGPTFIVKNENSQRRVAFDRWIFNAWGNKYDSFKADNVIPEKLAPILDLPVFDSGIVLEGGSIEVNGEGTLMTTEKCLLNPGRNPHLTKDGIETYLKGYLGVSHIIWLGEGIVGDDTDGHIDDVARFVSATTVLCAVEKDLEDANHTFLQGNLERLKRATDQNGKKLNVVQIPMPGVVRCDTGRLPASYANFYIGNAVVLVPIYGHSNDRIALQILRDFFPNREVIGILCESLAYGLGAIHCVTQQQPA